MSNIGKAIIVIGLIGIEGAAYTGTGWFTSIVLLGIGIIFLTIGSRENYIKKEP